ncbi:YpzG family protein [Mangrovibacillus cuniculi]|uniref:YpzG family protein n=1 Tax=Mangrovibacillus cuniculi TaxID=2593652 RepID=A0A7S8C9J9_9BACI|nr:YpzG family protein [Mangrovibacillus cuniculi]QPC45776.1 YpzG family protein [Mangrovibacillus cuniculi]
MGKKQNVFGKQHYESNLSLTHFNPKRQKNQVNGETQQTQPLLILEQMARSRRN